MPSFARLGDSHIHDILTFIKRPDLAPQTVQPTAPQPVDPARAHYRSSLGFMFAESGLPVIAPPWTTFTAYDLNTGDIIWQRPLGEVPELAAKGYKDTGSHFPRSIPAPPRAA